MRETAALLGLGRRMLVEADPRLLWKFSYNFGFKGMRSVQRFKKRIARGEYFPAVPLHLDHQQLQPPLPGLLGEGGRPARVHRRGPDGPHHRRRQAARQQLLRHPRRRAVHAPGAARHPRAPPGLLLPDLHQRPDHHRRDCQRACARIGNATPLISIEGTELVSDERRGRPNVLNHTLAGLDACVRNKLIVGVATSVCQTNIGDLLQRVVAARADPAWRRTTPGITPIARSAPTPRAELALTPEQVLAGPPLRRRHAHEAAARPDRCLLGRPRPGAVPDGHRHQPSHQPVGRHRAVPDHPVRARDGRTTSAICSTCSTIRPTSATSASSPRRRRAAASSSSVPIWCGELVVKHARTGHDASRGRAPDWPSSPRCAAGTASTTRATRVPEAHWAYRFAKKHWFFGFGAYS